MKTDHLDACLEILSDGFYDDPVMSWLFCNETLRTQTLKEWFRFWSELFGDAARLEQDASGDGAALWAIPYPGTPEPETMAPMVKMVAAHQGERTGEVLRGFGGIKPPERDYWYLNAIAARRGERARGVGARLLQPVLEEADQQRIPVYLESSNPDNLSFYRRFGFAEHAARIDLTEAGPFMQGMLRPVGGS